MADDQSVLTEREIKILLTKAEKDPYYVLTNLACQQAQFCIRFFTLCNEVMFDTPSRALEQSFIARRLAKETRDPHLMVKAITMVSAGYRIESLYTKAAACIAEALEQASGCLCCLAEIYRREGLNLLHERKFNQSYEAWSKSIHCYEQLNEPDGVASILIHRGALLDAMGRYAEALDDERNGLALLSDKVPPRYYIAGMVNMAAVLVNSEQYDDALACLQKVRESLKGQWGKYERVRVILRWIEGLIFAKIGRRRDAFKRLFSARNGIVRLGLHSEHYIAISADISKLYKIGTPRANDDQVIEIATECLNGVHTTSEEEKLLKELCFDPQVATIEKLREVAGCRVPSLL